MPSRIEWTDETWNPIIGCSRVSEGCRHCYAERQAIRQAGPGGRYEGLVEGSPAGPRWTGRTRLVDSALVKPFGWRRPRRIFVSSMGDPFHDSVGDDVIDRVFAVMGLTRRHSYQLLTKRPARMRSYLEGLMARPLSEATAELYAGNPSLARRTALDLARAIDLAARPLPNLWAGTSIEDQPNADARIGELLAAPAAVRFLSIEPLIGPVTLPWDFLDLGPRAWVIVGGESGPGARPMNPDWARSVRDQCQAAGVPFHFKQWGEWRPMLNGDPARLSIHPPTGTIRVGKKAAGRQLDGREWDEVPG